MRSAELLLTVCSSVVIMAVAVPYSATAASMDCLATDEALAYWRPLREQAAEIELDADLLATELISCLGSPNPELRDRIGYELFTYWLRQEKLTDASRRALLARLSDKLASGDALLRSFSALILAELMRSDANKVFMSDDERAALLESASHAISTESDFRGLVHDIGWVHPVAHMADLLWRFALHPATDSQQAAVILAAVRTKVAPTAVSYGFNEGDRLARAVSALITKGLVEPGTAGEWISSFQSPVSMDKWSDAFESPAGMAELHNTKQFLRALSDQLAGNDLDPRISEPLAALVNGFTQLI